MKIGYVRVSTKEQNTARQEELMKLLKVDRVYIDKMSGKDMERPFLQEMMNFVREGDSVVVESISRFARNTKDLLELTEQLNSKHVQFISQKENIDTNTPIGKAMMFITATFAQMERETTAARVTDNLSGLARKGFWTGGKAPQGYVLEHIEINGKKHATLAIDPKAAARCRNRASEQKGDASFLPHKFTSFLPCLTA